MYYVFLSKPAEAPPWDMEEMLQAETVSALVMNIRARMTRPEYRGRRLVIRNEYGIPYVMVWDSGRVILHLSGNPMDNG